MKRIVSTLLAVVFVPAPLFADDAKELASLAAARCSALHSATLKFVYEHSSTQRPYRSEIAFAGDKYRRSSGRDINHGDYQLTVGVAPDSWGYGKPEPLKKIEYANRPPWFAGTLWDSGECKWLEGNTDKFRMAGREKIDGHDCKIIEASWMPNEVLKLWVAPKLNGALPRYEVWSTDGVLKRRCVAIDFREYATGMFLPSKIIREQETAAQNGQYSLAQFDCEWSKVNEDYPDEFFTTELPADVFVSIPPDYEFRIITPMNSDRVWREAKELAALWKIEKPKRRKKAPINNRG